MNSPFGKRPHRSTAADGAAVGLIAVEPDRPAVRLRDERDGGTAKGSRGRRLLQPLPLAAALLILLALIGYWSVYQQTSRRSQILVAARALPAGHTLRASDLAAASLSGDSSLLAALVPVGERSQLIGRTLKTTVAAGAPLPQAALAPAGGTVAAFTLAVPALHALAGSLSPGDRVTVLATYTSAGGGAVTRPVARNLEVLAVGAASGFGSATQTIPVTVALPDPSLAAALALANEEGKLDLLREGGHAATAAIPAATLPAAGP